MLLWKKRIMTENEDKKVSKVKKDRKGKLPIYCQCDNIYDENGEISVFEERGINEKYKY